ncbi:unnamed protein product, partial [marine sediment metagenome]
QNSAGRKHADNETDVCPDKTIAKEILGLKPIA